MIPLNDRKNLHKSKLEGNNGGGKNADRKKDFVFTQKWEQDYFN
jgi:hypothetical protein